MFRLDFTAFLLAVFGVVVFARNIAHAMIQPTFLLCVPSCLLDNSKRSPASMANKANVSCMLIFWEAEHSAYLTAPICRAIRFPFITQSVFHKEFILNLNATFFGGYRKPRLVGSKFMCQGERCRRIPKVNHSTNENNRRIRGPMTNFWEPLRVETIRVRWGLTRTIRNLNGGTYSVWNIL